MKIAVFGATGFLGANLADRLVLGGHRVVALRRPRANVLHLRRLGVETVSATWAEPGPWAEALVGAEVAVHLAGHYPRTSQAPAEDLALAEATTRDLLALVAGAGVPRLIYVSSLATVAPADGRPSHEDDVFAADPGLGLYHSIKWRLERLVEGERRLAIHTLCPGACFGPYDLRLGTSALLLAARARALPPLPAGFVSPVDARDVAEAITQLAERGGPRRLLLSSESRPLGEVLAEVTGQAPPPPVEAAVALAHADAEERAALAAGRRPRIAKELVELLAHTPPIDSSRSRAFGLTYRPFAEAARASLAWIEALNPNLARRTA